MSVDIFNPSALEPEMLREYLLGCEEHLAEAETAFIELEKKPDDPGLVNDIFRHFHSLKGDSASIGAIPVRDLAHELESLLDKLRERQILLTAELLDLLLEGLNFLSGQVAKIAEGSVVPEATVLIRKLSGYTGQNASVLSKQSEARHSEAVTGSVSSEDEGADQKTYILFRTGRLFCAINVDQSNEIISPPHITPVPNVEKFIEGVINLRGSIVPVINLQERLKIQHVAGREPKILLLIINGMKLGLLVGEVNGVKTWSDARILKPEGVAFDLEKTFVSGVVAENAQLVLVLRTDEIIRRDVKLAG